MADFNSIFRKTEKNNGDYWLTISDIMSGLMIVFLFIAIVFMRHTSIEKDKVVNIAKTYEENQVTIYDALNTEFSADLSNWYASIDKENLSFQFNFNPPEVPFEAGSSDIQPKFKLILLDFIPRYLNVLEEYKFSIEEVRIEGHTSSEWQNNTSNDNAYFGNMKLSQDRTRSVLSYAYFKTKISPEQKNWIKSSFVAVGFSSSKLILKPNGVEDKQRSRRVTFRVVTNADAEIRKIVSGK